MKKLIIVIIILGFSINLYAQNPCYIKYTYDASGNRIKREFVCAPVDTIYGGGGTSNDDDCCPSARMINNSTNTELSNNEFDFVLSPNPVRNEVLITLKNSSNNKVKGAIVNNLGQEIVKFEMNSDFKTIDLSLFSIGIYYAVIQSENKKVVKKFVKAE